MDENGNTSRKIILSGDIDDNVAHNIISNILNVNEIDNQMSVVSTYEPEPIELYINSGGGYASSGFAIIGAMEMSDTPIVTIGLGHVASMALGIFASGDLKLAHRYTRFMYHGISYGMSGHIKMHQEYYKESDLIQDMYDDLFKDTELDKEKLQEIQDKKLDFYFSAKDAVRFKVADKIILNNK